MSTSTPLVPPRPARSSAPTVPPRPSSKSRSKSPEEPAPTTIPPNTELHAPVARPPGPKPTESGSGITTTNTLRDEQGIPQIGRRVPMYPNAGDVQAPSPAATPGAGRRSHVYREEWEMDEGAYGQGTPKGINPYTKSSIDLNQSVAQSPDAGAADTSTPVPDEEIGYLASEEYARVISPQPTGTPTSGDNPILRRGEEEAANLLYKATANPPNTGIDGGDNEISIHLDPLVHRGVSGEEEDSVALEDREHPILASDEVLKRSGAEFMSPAISPPLVPRRGSSIPNSRPQSVVPMGAMSCTKEGEDGDVEPVELSEGSRFEARDPLLQPGEEAEPLFPDDDDEDVDNKSKAGGSPGGSRDRARRPEMPGATGSHRFPSKDIWEEAPAHSQLQTTVSPRPPSHTETRDDGSEAAKAVERTGISPEYIQGQPNDHYQPGDEKEFEQRHRDSKNKDGDYRHQVQLEGRDDNLDRLLNMGKRGDEAVGLGDRNGAVRRFPSNDIWEDAPPSLQLSTTVTPSNETRGEETAEPKGETTTAGRITELGSEAMEGGTKPTTGVPIEGSSALKPEVPGRPQVPSTRPVRKAPPPQPERETDLISPDKKPPPVLPDRPKPKVLIQSARPASTIARSPSTESPSVVRGDAALGHPPPISSKPKPAIPPRTAGISGKIAALKAGFMSDLDQRLKLGPQVPKKLEKPAGEEVKEKEVLSDVRKNRARGPKGRKLPTAKEPENKPEEARPDAGPAEIQVVEAWTVWSADEEGVRVNDEPAVVPSEPEPIPGGVEEVKEDAASVLSTAPLSGEPAAVQQAVPVEEKDAQVPTTSPTATVDFQQEKAQLSTVIPESRDPEGPLEASGTSDNNTEGRQGDTKNPEGVQEFEV